MLLKFDILHYYAAEISILFLLFNKFCILLKYGLETGRKKA
jgi:hypothetical protein